MKYRKNLFKHSAFMIPVSEVKRDMVIELNASTTQNATASGRIRKLFYVDDIDQDFASEEIARLYMRDDEDDPDEKDIKPEHTLYTLIDESRNIIDFDRITHIPGDTLVTAYVLPGLPEHSGIPEPVNPISTP